MDSDDNNHRCDRPETQLAAAVFVAALMEFSSAARFNHSSL